MPTPGVDAPAQRGERRVRPQHKGTPGAARKVGECRRVPLEREGDRGRGGQHRRTGRRCGDLGRELAQRGKAGGVRAGEQFVQRRMDARPDDLREPEGGEPEQPWPQRVGGQNDGQFFAQRGPPLRRESSEVDVDGAAQVAQPDFVARWRAARRNWPARACGSCCRCRRRRCRGRCRLRSTRASGTRSCAARWAGRRTVPPAKPRSLPPVRRRRGGRVAAGRRARAAVRPVRRHRRSAPARRDAAPRSARPRRGRGAAARAGRRRPAPARQRSTGRSGAAPCRPAPRARRARRSRCPRSPRDRRRCRAGTPRPRPAARSCRPAPAFSR